MVKEKLIKRRNEKDFTQKDLAEYLNISQTQYSRKEKGEVEFLKKNGKEFQNYWKRMLTR